jgi:uroporphyrinogen decarboxylase
MNLRERFHAICNFEPVDRVPVFRFQGCVGGFYPELVARWREEHLFPPARSAESLYDYFGLERPEIIPIELGMWPPFGYKVLEEREGKELVQLPSGAISLQVKNNDYYCSMPQFVEHPVKTRADWERLKERYQHHDARYPQNWGQLVERYRQRGTVLRVGAGAGYVPGYYGHLRGLMGIETLSLMYYDDPQLVKDVNEHTLNFLLMTLDRCFSDVQVDMVVIGEDMAGRNGPLVSPAVFREFMMPYYQRFTAFCRDHGVVSIWVDSDGDMRKLIPLWIEAGVTGVMPCDVVLGQVDVMALREAFPRLLLAGGIDKRVIEEGRTFEEIDVEIERKVRPLVRLGGYFPGPDHAWSPQASLKNFRYYMDRLYDICQVSG